MVEFNVANEVVLDFPAITVCNSNPVRYKLWCKEDPSICVQKPGETFEAIRERHSDEYDKLSRRKRIDLGYQYKDFVLYADYEDEILTEPLVEYYDYEFTNCFTFNARWGEQQDVKNAILFNPVTGKASELILCLNIDIENYSNMTDTPSGRIKLVIHDNGIVPNPTYDAASLEAGAFYSYGIQKVITQLLESPYQTKCRNYEEEREVRTGAKMSQKNCLLECFKTQSEKKCGCTYRRLSLMYFSTPCESTHQKKCLEDVEDEVFDACNPQCPIACKKVEFQYVATDKEPLREKSSIYERMKIDKVFTSGKEMNRNMACVRIHYGSTEIRTLTHQPKYESIEVFSLLGGYSGLWLGFSLLSCYNYILKLCQELAQRNIFNNERKKIIQKRKKLYSGIR